MKQQQELQRRMEQGATPAGTKPNPNVFNETNIYREIAMDGAMREIRRNGEQGIVNVMCEAVSEYEDKDDFLTAMGTLADRAYSEHVADKREVDFDEWRDDKMSQEEHETTEQEMDNEVPYNM